jgi:hypothetical protein
MGFLYVVAADSEDLADRIAYRPIFTDTIPTAWVQRRLEAPHAVEAELGNAW